MLAALLFLLLQAPPDGQPAPPENSMRIDGIAAIVNDEVITESELRRRLESAKKSFGYQEKWRWEEYVRDELRRMIYERLLSQAAKRSSLNQERITQNLNKVIEEEERKVGGRTQLIEKLKEFGQTYDEFVAERRNQILTDYLYKYELGLATGSSGRPFTEIYVSPREMQQYYRTHLREFTQKAGVRGRQIFLSYERFLKPEDAEAKATELRKQLEDGEDFIELAKKFSDWKPESGGDLGWVEKDLSPYAPAIENFLLTNKPGALSKVMLVRGGVALIKVEEKREEKVFPFEEIQLNLYWKLLGEKEVAKKTMLEKKLLRESFVWPADLFLR